MKLSLLDRYKVIKHAIKLALQPEISNVTIISEIAEDEVSAYSVYAEGTSPVEPILKYFSIVGGKVDTLESLNNLASNHNLLTLRYFAKHNGLDPNDYGVRAYPISCLKDKTPVGEEEKDTTTYKLGGVE